MSISEMFQGSAAISAPIFGNDGKVIAAIAIGAPPNRFESQVQNLKKIISDVAARASGSTSDVQLPQLDDMSVATTTVQPHKNKKTRTHLKIVLVGWQWKQVGRSRESFVRSTQSELGDDVANATRQRSVPPASVARSAATVGHPASAA